MKRLNKRLLHFQLFCPPRAQEAYSRRRLSVLRVKIELLAGVTYNT